MASILVKAYIHQLFGSPDIQLLEFDTQQQQQQQQQQREAGGGGGGVEDLREAISKLVDGRPVALAWLDRDGDEIRLSSDEQLKLAVTHGVKDNVLRVSVRVDWLGLAQQRRERAQRRRLQCEQQNAAEEAAARATAVDESERMDAADDDEASRGTAAAGTEDDEATEEAAVEREDAETTAEPVAKEKRTRRCRHGQCPGNSSRYTGFVRTVGADGLSKERELSAEEAAYLMNRSSASLDIGHCPPFSLAGSLFNRPQVEHRHSSHTPLFLAW